MLDVGQGLVPTDEDLFSLIRRITAIESQLVTRRAFVGGPDDAGSQSYRELESLRRELAEGLGYFTPPGEPPSVGACGETPGPAV